MISGKDNLLDLMNANQGGSVVGFYAYSDQRIRVRGDKLTPYTKVTLVHELTHALQDQYFDLGAETKRLRDSQTVDDTAYRAIVEGDARRIEDDYRNSLSKAAQKAVTAEEDRFTSSSQKGLEKVPEFLQMIDYAPYPLGNAVIEAAFKTGGNPGVDDLFRKAPEHDIELIDPWLLQDKSWKPTPVTKPALGAGEKEIDRGTFGVLSLYFLMTKGNSVTTALKAAEGDGGDLYVDYTKDGVACTRATFAGTTAAATQTLAQGLKNWAMAARTGATITSSAAEVTLNTCDPGSTYKASGDHSIDGLYVLTLRNGLVTYMGGKTSTRNAVCYADGVVSAYAPDQLRAIDAGKVQMDRTKLMGIARTCF